MGLMTFDGCFSAVENWVDVWWIGKNEIVTFGDVGE
jgi:hypothetical protein